MTAGASRAAPTIAQQPALAPPPQPRPAPTARALPPGLVEQGGQNWTPIGGQIWTPIDRLLPAGAVAGWGLHPQESAALSRRTPRADVRCRKHQAILRTFIFGGEAR